MKIYECVECGAKFDISTFTPGKQLKCGKCKAVFVVPDRETEAYEAVNDVEPTIMESAASGASASSENDSSFFDESAEAPQNVFKKHPRPGAHPQRAAAPRAAAPVPRRAARPAPEPEPEPEPVRGPSRGRGSARGAQPAAPAGRGGYAPPPARSNTMLFAGIGGAAVVLIGLGVFFMMGDKGKGKGGAAKDGEEVSEQDEAFKKLKRYADDSPSQMFDYAEACWNRNKREEAEEYYVRAAKKGHAPSQGKCLALFNQFKLPGTNGDTAKMADLISWLDALDLKDDAKSLAKTVANRDPSNAIANKYIGNVLVDGKWLDPVEAELAEVGKRKGSERAAFDKMSPRERRIVGIQNDFKDLYKDLKGGERKKLYLDCSPEAPYLLAMEESTSYNAQLMMEDFKGCVKQLFELFFKRYGTLFDVEKFKKEEVNFIMIFESRERYMEGENAPYFAGGHFNTQTGRIFIYKDTPQLYETLFHEGIHQLCHNLSQMMVEKDSERSNVNMFWFTEGIACFFGAFKRDATGGFVLGEVDANYLPQTKQMIAAGKHMKLDPLMKMTYLDFARKSGDPKFVGQMYCQSWSVVYFMYTFQNGKYKSKFDEYFKKETASQGSYKAAKEIFGDLDALNKEYEEFYKNLK
jgi:hypothetical protein